MTFADILSLRTFSDVQIREDGQAVAMVVKQPRVEQDDTTSTLFIKDLTGKARDFVVAGGKSARNVRWRPATRELGYFDGTPGRLVLLNTETLSEREMVMPELEKGGAPLSFEWSPDGTRLGLLVSRTPPPPSQPFLNSAMAYARNGNKPALDAKFELYVISADGSQVCRSGETGWTRVGGLTWGTGGGTVGLISMDLDEKTGSVGNSAVLMSTTSCKEMRRMPDSNSFAFGDSDADVLRVVQAPSVRPDGGFQFSPPASSIMRSSRDGKPGAQVLLVASRAAEHSADPPPVFESVFFQSGEVIAEAADRSMGSLFRIRNGEMVRIPRSNERISGCSVASKRPIAACVIETVTDAPEVGVVDLRSGAVQKVTQFNDAMKAAQLGKVERVTVPDDHGNNVTMYLVYPTDYRPGQRYPALVLMYGFNSSFIGQAQYITSYAPQVYASRGYVTLLWNYPYLTGGGPGDLEAQARDLQLGEFATTLHAVDMLVERGLADPAKIGIAGHSMGSHWTDYAVTHSDRFVAAASHAPGGYSPMAYWQGPTFWRRRLDRIFGGPPSGKSLAAWQALAPSLFPAPKIPMIREVPEEAVSDEAAFRAWIDSGARVETWVYPNETHVFHTPKGRLSSLELNADWFDFWLRGVEDGSPAKRERYERWRGYRDKP